MIDPKKKFAFVIWGGKSDIGKDLISDLIAKYIPITKIKFSSTFKKPFEQMLDIPEGSLEDKTFRQRKIINPVTGEEEDFSYNEFMYHCFHHFKSLYPTGRNWLVPGGTKKQIMESDTHLTFVDVRNETEVELLRRFKDRFNFIFLYVVSDRGEEKTSDRELHFLSFEFIEVVQAICNNKNITVEQLDARIVGILKDLRLYET